VLEARWNDYKRAGKVVHRKSLLLESDVTIMTIYQAIVRGIANSSRLAYNMYRLDNLSWVLETSRLKTLAKKHGTSMPAIANKYRATSVVGDKKYTGLQVKIPREEKRPFVATWGGEPLAWDIGAPLEERVPPIHERGRTELVQRLLAGVCELCASTDDGEMHQVRAMKDLHEYPGGAKPEGVRRMIALRRKTMPLCRTCHEDVHAGRPVRRQPIEFTEVKAIRKESMTTILESRMR
jgi:hypothetical protein